MSGKIRGKLLLLAGGAVSVVLLILTLVCVFVPEAPRLLTPLAVIASLFALCMTLLAFKYQSQVQYAAEHTTYYDTFTAMPNGLRLQKDFQELGQRENHVLVVARLNGFNRMATLFGLPMVGKTIQQLCPSLQEFAEKHGGVAYRVALDRFALLAVVHDRQNFLADLQKLFSDLEKIRVKDQHVTYSYHYTFSYGVYFTSDLENAMKGIEEIANLTNTAVERIQEHNKTTWTVFSEENRPDWELRDRLQADVAGAWRNREFVPYYQMMYDLKDNRPVGAELYTRWQHPELGLVMPGDFLPVMESEGLIMDLDLYMLEEACKKIKGWIDAELVTVPLAVNLSKLNIHRQDFVEKAIELVQSYDIPPILIEFELTEAVLLYEKNQEFIELMDRLHKFGFTLCMDNFAADDFASINLLRDLPIDVIKISPNFFANVQESQRDRIFVENVIQMAKELDIRIVVMGVETQEQAELFRAIGCNYAQGFYFSRPISNEAFEEQIF